MQNGCFWHTAVVRSSYLLTAQCPARTEGNMMWKRCCSPVAPKWCAVRGEVSFGLDIRQTFTLETPSGASYSVVCLIYTKTMFLHADLMILVKNMIKNNYTELLSCVALILTASVQCIYLAKIYFF